METGRTVYRCRNCGERFYAEQHSDIGKLLKEVVQKNIYWEVGTVKQHNCPDRINVGIADFAGVEKEKTG